MSIVMRWHSWLNMPKFDKKWHEDDIDDEYQEYLEETKLLKKWSELSDIVYTYTRATWSGHKVATPVKQWQIIIGLPYMYIKYTSRYLFYRSAGRKAGANKYIRCVRNPKKPEKLEQILKEQKIQVDVNKLHDICRRQRRYWILIP